MDTHFETETARGYGVIKSFINEVLNFKQDALINLSAIELSIDPFKRVSFKLTFDFLNQKANLKKVLKLKHVLTNVEGHFHNYISYTGDLREIKKRGKYSLQMHTSGGDIHFVDEMRSFLYEVGAVPFRVQSSKITQEEYNYIQSYVLENLNLFLMQMDTEFSKNTIYNYGGNVQNEAVNNQYGQPTRTYSLSLCDAGVSLLVAKKDIKARGGTL